MAGKIKNLLNKYTSLPIQVRAAFWFLVCSFMQKGISTITTPIFTRLLSTEEYGQYSVFNSWLGIVSIFVSMNLYCGVYMQRLVKFIDTRDVYSSSLQGLTLFLTLIWTVIYLLFHSFWNTLLSLTTVQMLAMLVMIWASAVFGFWSSAQRVDFSYRKLVLVTVLVSIAKPLVGIIFVVNADDKVTARILGLALVELVGYSWMFVSQVRRGKRLFVWENWKFALLFNLPLVPHYLSQTVLNSADRIMIGKMVGDDAAGIYSLAYSISLIMTMFNTALTQTLEPWRYKKLKEGKVDDIAKIAYPSLIMIAALNLIVIALAPEVVAIFAPPAYRDAIWVIPPVCMSVYFMFTYGYFAVFEFYYEKTRYVMVATTAGAVLNIILNYIFIDIYGYYAAGYTTLVCYIVYSFAHYHFMRKICREKLGGKKVYSMKKLLSISAVFMICGFVFMFTYRLAAIRYGIFAAFIALAVLCRKWLISTVKQFVSVRNNK